MSHSALCGMRSASGWFSPSRPLTWLGPRLASGDFVHFAFEVRENPTDSTELAAGHPLLWLVYIYPVLSSLSVAVSTLHNCPHINPFLQPRSLFHFPLSIKSPRAFAQVLLLSVRLPLQILANFQGPLSVEPFWSSSTFTASPVGLALCSRLAPRHTQPRVHGRILGVSKPTESWGCSEFSIIKYRMSKRINYCVTDVFTYYLLCMSNYWPCS